MPQWCDLAGVDELEDDDVVQVTGSDGHQYAVYQVDGRVYVTDDRCTHQEASLAEGYLDGETIECPRHQGVFNICTGKVLSPPLEKPLRTYPVTVENGRVLIELDSG